MTDTHSVGKRAELFAKHYLEKQGLRFIAQNYRGPKGEIDLIMQAKNELVFVEVRVRNHPNFGSGAESVTSQKQRKIIKTAQHYLDTHHLNDRVNCRFDVISLCYAEAGDSLEWISDAFTADEPYE